MGVPGWLWATSAVALGYLIQVLVQPSFPVFERGAVVITGASSGIGLDAAAELQRRGYTVYAGVRKAADGEKLASQHPGMRPLILDVTKEDSIAAAVSTVRADLDRDGLRLVALVNNAGVQADMPVELQPAAANRFNFEVNVFGVFDTTSAFLPLLRATGPGARIVNMGSLAGVLAAPGSASYSASKFAVEGFTDALRMEVQDFGISVSLIQPGYVRSQMGAKAHQNSASGYGVSAEQYEAYRRTVFDGFFAKDKKLSSPELTTPPAESTTPAIVEAVSSPTPQTRYAVAWVEDFPAWFLVSLKSLMPDRIMDILTTEL